VGKKTVIPHHHDKRSKALALAIATCTANGFMDEKSGKASQVSFDALLKNASVTAGTVSQKVGAKNELRKSIVKTHNALINVLKGNYPDEWKSVIREWGFQKENY